MRLIDLTPFLPIAALVFAPLACSSTSSDDSATADNDGGDQGDDSGDTTGDGGTGKDSSGPFTPGAHPSYPQVPNNSGGVITNAKFVIIIPSNESTTGLPGFGAAFAASSTWKGMASEYGLGTARTPVTVTGASLSGSQSQSSLQNYVEANTGGNDPDGHTIYLVFLPSAANLDSDPGCNQSGIGGYHTAFFDGFSGSTDGWGVVQHCSAQVRGAITEAQWATIAASHEIVEAATDFDGQSGFAFPNPQSNDPRTLSIWDDVLLTEVGDLCVETQITEGTYTYQRMWSNKAARSNMDPCAPSITPFFNTGATGADTNGWFKTTSGKVVINLEGFSNAPLDPWLVGVVIGQQTENGWSGNLSTPEGSTAQHQIGNGEKGTLTVVSPAGATSGSYAIFELVSQSTEVTSGESFHIWPIGVYVP